MTVTQTPTPTLDARLADTTTTTCTSTLRLPRHPRVRFAMSERAARRHLEQFGTQQQGR